MITNKVVLRTVGLSKQKQSELSIQLSFNLKLDLQHLSGWNFDLLAADVIVLGTDVSIGQETLDMLRRYAGAKEPLLVTYSEHDERMRALGGMSGQPPFGERLSQALHGAGCREEEIRWLTSGVSKCREVPLCHEGPKSSEDIRWMD